MGVKPPLPNDRQDHDLVKVTAITSAQVGQMLDEKINEDVLIGSIIRTELFDQHCRSAVLGGFLVTHASQHSPAVAMALT